MTYLDTRAVPAPLGPAQPDQDVQNVRVRSHLVAAVLVTLFCFAPTGGAAVVWGGNVRTRLALGDVEGARQARRCPAPGLGQCGPTVAFLLVVVVGANDYSDTH